MINILEKPSFVGKCYGCYNKEKNNWSEIVFNVCWGEQISKPYGYHIRRGWYFFCKKCCGIFDLTPNRKRINLKGGKKITMVKLLERAQNYEPAGKLKNISELKSIPVDIDVSEKIFAEGTDKEFKAEVFSVEGEDYKMPVTVISSLKVILEENPKLKSFKVKKSGTGLGTEYTVIPLS